jgi:hypothetical protein
MHCLVGVIVQWIDIKNVRSVKCDQRLGYIAVLNGI